jgi:hypothetical protein
MAGRVVAFRASIPFIVSSNVRLVRKAVVIIFKHESQLRAKSAPIAEIGIWQGRLSSVVLSC